MSSIRVRLNNETRALPLPAEEKTLLEVLRGAGYSLPAACGGRGRCGKCRVRINGVPRLACRVHPADGDEIELPETGAGAILTQSAAPPRVQPGRTGCAAAVDLGTTTVAVRLYDRADGCALGTDAAWNAQAAYGADVISRIQYTLERADGLRELSERIRAQVWALIRGLLKKAGRGKGDLREVVLAGNTAMQLLFTGHSVRGLAAAPFLPETLFRGDAEDALEGIPLRLVPCIAGYVGGDITAGLLASGLAGRPGRVLFLDAGTNGEMALGGRGGFLCCSVAAGPAFEGAGIACGMPGLPGAVSHVVWRGGFLMDVIGGGAPRGLCGSGLVDLAAVLLHLGAITPAGRLLPPEEAPAALRPGCGSTKPAARAFISRRRSISRRRTCARCSWRRRRSPRGSACLPRAAARRSARLRGCISRAASARGSALRAPSPSACSPARSRGASTDWATRPSLGRPCSRSTARRGSRPHTSPGAAAMRSSPDSRILQTPLPRAWRSMN